MNTSTTVTPTTLIMYTHILNWIEDTNFNYQYAPLSAVYAFRLDHLQYSDKPVILITLMT